MAQRLWGMWKGTFKTHLGVDSVQTTIVLVFDRNDGYSAWSPAYQRTRFTYSVTTPNRLTLAAPGFKPSRSTVLFLPNDHVRFHAYPAQEDAEAVDIVDTVTFHRLESPAPSQGNPRK